jgi:nitroimidazol reductase NimA-like FMN-containing flavoprotein (pyridoxamine 5'-phosphate oxidase superfamily)
MSLLDARRTFGDLDVVHLATTLPDGSPHTVPLWFVWREEAIYVSARRGSATWRNVERDHRVALAFHRGRAWNDLAGVVIHGRAEPLSVNHPALRGVMSDWFEKYRGALAGEGFRSFAQQVEHPGMLRVRALRMAAWDHAVAGSRSGSPEHRGAHG